MAEVKVTPKEMAELLLLLSMKGVTQSHVQFEIKGFTHIMERPYKDTFYARCSDLEQQLENLCKGLVFGDRFVICGPDGDTWWWIMPDGFVRSVADNTNQKDSTTT